MSAPTTFAKNEPRRYDEADRLQLENFVNAIPLPRRQVALFVLGRSERSLRKYLKGDRPVPRSLLEQIDRMTSIGIDRDKDEIIIRVRRPRDARKHRTTTATPTEGGSQ